MTKRAAKKLVLKGNVGRDRGGVSSHWFAAHEITETRPKWQNTEAHIAAESDRIVRKLWRKRRRS